MRLLTPRGHAGVAVLAAGPGERAALLAALRSRSGGAVTTAPGGPPRLCTLRLDGADLDEGLLVDRGERGLELHLHGAPAVLDAVERRFGPFPRETTTPAEVLLRSALSAAQLDLALEQRALDFAAFLASLDALPDAERRAAAAAALARSLPAQALAMPHRVVLVGAQNAGKSTLLNRLLFRERAVTGPLPGLTRDSVREVTELDGYPYEFVDTAGEGPAATAVDARALERARAEREGADRLLVVDGSLGPSAVDRALRSARTFVVANKSDLPAGPWPDDFPCDLRLSCREPENAPAVRTAVGALLRERRSLPPAGAAGGVAALDEAQAAALRCRVAGRPA